MATEPIPQTSAAYLPPANLALTQKEQNTVQVDPQEWSDSFALKVVMQDFQRWEAYRSANHDRRFREAERLVSGWVEKKFWEGTKVQRSSVAVFIALQEIEVLMSRLIDSVFSDDPPFACTPLPGTTLAQAFAVRNLLASQLRDIGKPGQFLTIREVFRRASKSSLTYSAGIIEMGWYISQIDRRIYDRRAVAETTETVFQGQTVQAPTGKLKLVSSMRVDKRLVSRPLVQNIDIRDFYIDPDCPSPNPQDSPGGTATRHLLTIEEIKNIGSNPNSGFKLPTDAQLLELANQKFSTQGDQSKQTQEAYRGNSWQPTYDKSVDPALRKVELIRFWRKNRHVEILGRRHTFFNECNPYGIVPHLNLPYIDLLGRFYGLSIPDLVEGDHKLAMSILNDRIDELNILLHPPIIRRAGNMMGTSGKRFHPGASWEIKDGNPREEVIRMEMGAVNPQAFAEVNALEQRVQKLTGNTDAAAYGVPSAGGDSSSRTATGVQSKQTAASGRIGYQVSNLEDQVLEPFLYILLALNKIYLDPSQVQEILGPDAQLFQLDPLDVLNADVHFKVTASQRMKTKQGLQSGGINFILQAILNPAFQAQANMIGMTADLKNIDALISDAYELPAMTLMRQMTPQEQQNLQAQHQAEMMAKMQMQTERLQSNQNINAEKDDTKVLAAALAKVLTPEAVHALFESAFGMKHPADVAEAAKARYAPPKTLKG